MANPVNAMNSFVFSLRVVFYSRELLTTNKCFIHLLCWLFCISSWLLFLGIRLFQHSQWTVSTVIGLPAPGLFLTWSFSSEFTKCTTNPLEFFIYFRVCSQNPKPFLKERGSLIFPVAEILYLLSWSSSMHILYGKGILSEKSS